MSAPSEIRTPPPSGAVAKHPPPAGLFDSKIAKALGFAGTVATAVGIAASVVSFFAATPELSLTIWVDELTILYPSKATGGAVLPLAFDGRAAGSVTTAKIVLSNDGKALIGSQEQCWKLVLTAAGASRVELIGAIGRTPAGIVARQTASSDLSELTLEIGALQRGAVVELRVMLMDVQSETPKLMARSSLAGLPHEVTTLAPAERRAAKLYTPFFLLFLPLFLGLLVFELWKDWETIQREGRRARAVAGRFAGALFLSMVMAVFVSKGLGRVLLWLGV